MRFVARALAVSLAVAVMLFAPRSAQSSDRATATRAAAQSSEAFQRALIQPEELLRELKRPKVSRPIVLHVGFEVLYRGGHIPGAIYTGPAMRPEGLAALRRAAARIPREREVVIYCGCCPMTKCPNVYPAFVALQKMGFRHLRVLDLPQGFGPDWAEKGLPVAKGAPAR
jgi:3-mercaptopyruvate sulfurtransferase SseA